MNRAKEIIIKPIAFTDANRIIKTLHYSGKVVNNSQIHLGVFLDGHCGGAMQFGPSLDKRKLQTLVKGTLWNEFIELNRMAFADWLPRNSESRAIGYAMRWLKKSYPFLKWVISFADAAQCGDGVIYRASGFYLTGIKKNDQIWEAPQGERFSRTSETDGRSKNQQNMAIRICRISATKGSNIIDTGGASMKAFKDAGFKPLSGFQLRYIFFLNKECMELLTVPVLPFSVIKDRGARMYKGEKLSMKRATSSDSAASAFQAEEGGASPTVAL